MFSRLLKETDWERLKGLIEKLDQYQLPPVPGLEERLARLDVPLNSAGFDRWGFHPDTLRKVAPLLHWIYTKYFRVEVVGVENCPSGPALYIGNHGGQLPVDAMMVGMALFQECDPPKVGRAMVERWVPTLPFVSGLFSRLGAMVGDPENCLDLLRHGQSVLVFPEGARGSGKLYADRYQLQRFGTGFVRLALETKAPIVPVAIVGTEEMYPSIYNLKSVAKWIGAPYFPITPFFPFLGPLGLLPLPTKVTIRFGAPIYFEGDHHESEELIKEKAEAVKTALRKEIEEGLRKRGKSIFGEKNK
jgi:1-acyl-sn-glycerol-3-phosphate acyltransferase